MPEIWQDVSNITQIVSRTEEKTSLLLIRPHDGRWEPAEIDKRWQNFLPVMSTTDHVQNNGYIVQVDVLRSVAERSAQGMTKGWCCCC